MNRVGKVEGNIIDLYCGSGSIGLSFLACGIGKSVKGIEIVADAVQNAYQNAQSNNLAAKADFFAGKAEILLGENGVDESFFSSYLLRRV